MKKFRTVYHSINTHRIIPGKTVRFAVLADLHGLEFGPGNERLIQKIQECSPDAVLVSGDVIVRNCTDTFDTAAELLTRLAESYPVFYALGNHEYKLYTADPGENGLAEEYLKYEERLKKAGVRILHNQCELLEAEGCPFTVYGLEIPLIYYKKPKSPMLQTEEIEQLIGKPDQDRVNLLLAHNPKYGNAYFEWGADLILSGHYHGGIVRFGRNKGILSPQFQLFPPYCCGAFHRKNQHMYVSAGLGEHTIPVRIHNPRELLIVDYRGREEK